MCEFHEHTPYGLGVMARTQILSRTHGQGLLHGHTSKTKLARVLYIASHCLDMTKSCVKFREYIPNGQGVISRTQILNIPVSILYKFTTGRYRPVRVADGPITARCRFIKNASWDYTTWVLGKRRKFQNQSSQSSLHCSRHIVSIWFSHLWSFMNVSHAV